MSIGVIASLMMSACSTVKVPNIDFIKFPEFLEEARNIKDYPKVSDAPSAPEDVRSAKAWDDAAKAIIDQRETYTASEAPEEELLMTTSSDNWEEFYRIKRLPPYVFAEVNKLKAELRAEGQDIIDFGFGNPDLPTPKHVIEKLIETVQKPRTTGYSVSRGIMGLRQACSRYYARRFDVELDPKDEIIATLGSKEGFANLAQAITAPGDVIYAPDPSYPLHAYGFIIAGAKIQGIPAITAEQYLQGVKAELLKAKKPPMAIVVCFPSNPTGRVADISFYREIVAIAKKHNIIVLSDLAYSEIYFSSPPPSIFQVDGAKDVAIETISLSKTYSMAGWRMGFAVGSKRLIAALARVKSYLD